MDDLHRLPRVITVTVNPAVDLFISVDTLTPGHLHRVNPPQMHAGGKGINVSKVLAELGVPTVASGLVGGRRGRWLLEALQDLGVATSFTEIGNETRMNVKVIEADGALTELNSAAPEFTRNEFIHFEDALKNMPSSGDWIALCGNLPSECDESWYQTTISWAREQGIHTLLDASGKALKKGIAAKPDIVKPNTYELSQLMGTELTTVPEIVKAARSLVVSGIRIVVISMGEDGLAAVTENESVHVQVPHVSVASSVGAGDTVVGALLYGLVNEWSIADTVKFAAAAGTAKVQLPGTRHPSREEIEMCLQETKVEIGGGTQ